MPSIENSPPATTQNLNWLAAILAIAAALAYGALADWPLGTHVDEVKKVGFVLSGEQDFLHPILMVQLARLANALVGYTDPIQVLGLARIIAAIFGGLLVFATFVLARMVLSPLAAIAVVVAVAVCPLVAVHATFFKEGIFVAPAMIFAIAALIRLTEHLDWKRSLVLGSAIGIAVSAKYVGALTLPVAIIAILIASQGQMRDRLQAIAIVTVVSAATFAIVNAPLFTDFEVFQSGLDFEVNHALDGHHDIRLPISTTFGILHLTKSLLPGLGLPLLIIGLAGLLAPIVNREKRRRLAIILSVAALWYFAHEITPLKPFPDFERYMVPLAPLILILGACFLETVLRPAAFRGKELVTPLVIAGATLPAIYSSYLILDAASLDPRSIVPKIAHALGPATAYDPYSTFDNIAAAAASHRLAAPPRTIVTSDFRYARFLDFGQRDVQSPEVGRLIRKYDQLFTMTYLEISNGGPSFAFLSPTLRIVAVDRNLARLQAIGEAIIEAEPELKITIGT
jgi:hypothetical protein